MPLKQIESATTIKELDAVREKVSEVAMKGDFDRFIELRKSFMDKKNEIYMKGGEDIE